MFITTKEPRLLQCPPKYNCILLVFPKCHFFFFTPEAHPKYHITFSHVSLVFTVTVSDTFCFAIVLKSNDKIFCKMCLNWIYLKLISWLDGFMGFGEYHRRGEQLSSPHIRAYKLFIDYLILNYLTKVQFSWFLHYKFTFPFSFFML